MLKWCSAVVKCAISGQVSGKRLRNHQVDMLHHIKHSLLIALGIISLLVGVVGIFLPLLPTVPLVLLSAFCFARSSERLHRWLVEHRHFGSIIRNFESGRGVPRRVKLRAITVIWISMGISSWIVARPLLILMLIGIGAAVSVYLYRLPEYNEAAAYAKQTVDDNG